MTTRFTPLAARTFEAMFDPWRRRRVEFRVTGLPAGLPPDVPVILAANHVSYWDPFLLRHLQRLLRPRAPFYTVMLERELERHGWMRRIGVVGLEPGSASSLRRCIRFLRNAVDERPDAMIAFFPQGRIWPSFRRPLAFRAGVSLLARAIPGVRILPAGLHLEPLNRPRPTLFASLAPATDGASTDVAALESAVTGEIDRVLWLMEMHGESALSHWPPPNGALGDADPAVRSGAAR
jgi:1-acyl-sn-glycerol-3-phosphate acyltransferase